MYSAILDVHKKRSTTGFILREVFHAPIPIAFGHTADGRLRSSLRGTRKPGTRYCGNNCVYKARRFNYFDYGRDNFPGLLRLMLNPDVTVRNKGVMEKCSFCIQRIDAARQKAKDEKREIRDGEVVTACQQSCPTQAIRFGNTRDPNSAVVAKADQPARAFASLQDLNTRPGITYLPYVDYGLLLIAINVRFHDVEESARAVEGCVTDVIPLLGRRDVIEYVVDI